jgi:hypothetical protein
MKTYDATPYYTAVGLALLISQLNPTGKRILTIDNVPCWINLDNAHTLMEQIECIEFYTKSHSATTANICNSIDIIAYSIQHMDEPEEQDIQLVVLSNFECCLANQQTNLYTQIENRFNIKYTENDIQINNIPQIVFWNLANRTIVENPAPFYTQNTKVLSGFSIENIKHLNRFRFSNVDAYDELINMLSIAKYTRFHQCIEEIVK